MQSKHETSQDQWELHRREIQTLYFAENKSLGEVMSYMKRHRNFDARYHSRTTSRQSLTDNSSSKAQYERQFKKWNLRKYLNNSDWEYIHHRVEKRKKDGKESVVYSGDIEVPPKRIKKEISRRFPPTFAQEWTIGAV